MDKSRVNLFTGKTFTERLERKTLNFTVHIFFYEGDELGWV